MKTLLLIDANSLIHRAYHALPPLTTPEGEPIGAIYGLASTLIKILKEQKPDYIAAAFDRPEPTFREGLFKDYKAKRPKIDKELVIQLRRAHELFQNFNIPTFEAAGFEADDVIATLVKIFKGRKEFKIVILTGDLDTLQLVYKNKVVVEIPKKGVSETVIYNEEAVKSRYGLKPNQLPDWKGLVGDPSDNIPGVPGVGPKTASRILQEYKNLENLYKRLKPSDKLGEKLISYKGQVLFSKKLVTLEPRVPLEVEENNLIFTLPQAQEIIRYFTYLGFQSLVKRSFDVFSKKPSPKQEPQKTAQPLKEDVLVVTNLDDILQNIRELNSPKTKIAFDWKPLLKELFKRNITPTPPLYDLKIAGWLLDPDQKDLSLNSLSKRFLLRDVKEGRPDILLEFYRLFKEKIKEYELERVFKEIEMPLIEVLAKMEEWGIGVNVSLLEELEREIEEELKVVAKNIYKEAGMVFNINSSRQVAGVLFEKLGIKSEKIRKTMMGFRSTALDILKQLKEKHPIVGLIIDYRENFKINSTFVKPFIKLVGDNGRVHGVFLQTGTATGRLSSQEPNLQNLPQESKWSKKLRTAFQAEQDSSFLAFDYSQIELRLLAHLSGDKKLRKAFQEGVDIHKVTASQVFNMPLEEVTETMRRAGKILNFGIIYGMGPKALSSISGIPAEKAKNFIEEYFRDFPAVRDWQNRMKNEARTFGYIKNENGRRRWFLNALSVSPQAEAEIDRTAINMPIQSLGADILKLAMIETFKKLKERGWLGSKAKLVLTIHDELLFEVSDDILKEVTREVKEIMERIYKLSVPLQVEVKSGKNLGNLYYVQKISPNL